MASETKAVVAVASKELHVYPITQNGAIIKETVNGREEELVFSRFSDGEAKLRELAQCGPSAVMKKDSTGWRFNGCDRIRMKDWVVKT